MGRNWWLGVERVDADQSAARRPRPLAGLGAAGSGRRALEGLTKVSPITNAQVRRPARRDCRRWSKTAAKNGGIVRKQRPPPGVPRRDRDTRRSGRRAAKPSGLAAKPARHPEVAPCGRLARSTISKNRPNLVARTRIGRWQIGGM